MVLSGLSDGVENGNVRNLTLNIGKGRCQKHPEVGGTSFLGGYSPFS